MEEGDNMKKEKVILIITTSIIALVLFFLIDRKNIGSSGESPGFNGDISREVLAGKSKIQLQEPGDSLADFQLEDLDGNLISLKDYRGQTVFINFWASWSQESLEDLEEFERINRQDNIQVLNINVREDQGTVEKVLEARDLDLKVLLDRDGNIGLDYVVGKLPTTYVVDGQGRLIEKVTGAMDFQSILNKIEE